MRQTSKERRAFVRRPRKVIWWPFWSVYNILNCAARCEAVTNKLLVCWVRLEFKQQTQPKKKNSNILSPYFGFKWRCRWREIISTIMRVFSSRIRFTVDHFRCASGAKTWHYTEELIASCCCCWNIAPYSTRTCSIWVEYI